MNNISMNQALDIWGELWQAYFGKNGFGSDEAEIYAYRLMPYRPAYSYYRMMHNDKGSYKDDYDKIERQAACSMRNIAAKFADDNDCLVSIDGVDADTWLIRNKIFNDKCIVKVIHKDKNKK